jgi:hypothetical protein
MKRTIGLLPRDRPERRVGILIYTSIQPESNRQVSQFRDQTSRLRFDSQDRCSDNPSASGAYYRL